jgi:hypothetical protein
LCGGREDQQGCPTQAGGLVQLNFESLPQPSRPVCNETDAQDAGLFFLMIHIWVEI